METDQLKPIILAQGQFEFFADVFQKRDGEVKGENKYTYRFLFYSNFDR